MDYRLQAIGVRGYAPQPALVSKTSAKRSVDQFVLVRNTTWRQDLDGTEMAEVASLG